MLEQYRKEKDKKIKIHRRVFSRVIAKQFLRDLKPNTMKFIEGNGFFRNALDYRLSSELLPGMYYDTSLIASEDFKMLKEAECKIKSNLELFEVARQTVLKEHAFAK